MSIPCPAITTYLDKLLKIAEIKDVSCNGLQCAGTREIKKIGLAVNACMQTYEQAVAKKCQLLFVHHGFIWGGIRKITGPVFRQIKYLITHNLNVYAAHVPLDVHPKFGNNIELAKELGLRKIQPFGTHDGTPLGYVGYLTKELTIHQIAAKLQQKTGGQPIFLSFGKKRNRSVGIVSGAASQILTEAIEKNIDCFVTGEPAHHHHHTALEGGINVIYLGHYHSEQHGVLAIGKQLEKKFGVKTVFLDSPTIV